MHRVLSSSLLLLLLPVGLLACESDDAVDDRPTSDEFRASFTAARTAACECEIDHPDSPWASLQACIDAVSIAEVETDEDQCFDDLLNADGTYRDGLACTVPALDTYRSCIEDGGCTDASVDDACQSTFDAAVADCPTLNEEEIEAYYNQCYGA